MKPLRVIVPARRRAHEKPNVWLIPAIYSGVAIAAGLTLPRIEHAFLPGLPSSVSVPAATAIYSSIASGMIALTGIVFSLTFVMVQFSATAYSPRLVLWVARHPILSHALGVFTATFLYALAALAWVDRAGSGRVSLVSALTVILLLDVSVAMFVALIRHGDDGQLRLVMPCPIWEDFLRLAFDEIRFYGATSMQVMRRMRALIGDLLVAVPAERRPALVHWQQRLNATVRRSFADPEERMDASAEDRQGIGTPGARASGQ